MTALFFAYHFAVLAMLVFTLAMLVANLSCFASLKKTDTPLSMPRGGKGNDDLPLVSVLVPARNEARRIAPCVQSLLAQDYPSFELLVLDDNSEDETARILRQLGLGEDDPDRRLIAGAPLPTGWTGKCWACQQLASHARGEWLFFTDADTAHSSGVISAALAHAQRSRADLLSAWPRLVTRTLGEKLVIPIIHVLAVALYPHVLLAFLQHNPARARRLSRSALRALGGANGQFLFFKKSSYEKIGGHAAVCDHLVEDVALGREIALRIGEGMRLVNCDASRLVDCRMYSSFREVWEGFTKNIYPAYEGALALWWLSGAMLWSCFFLPFVLVLFAAHRRFAAMEVALVYVIRVILTARLRTSWLGCLLHPAGHFLAMCIALNSWRRAGRGGVTWKGRRYRVGKESSSSS